MLWQLCQGPQYCPLAQPTHHPRPTAHPFNFPSHSPPSLSPSWVCLLPIFPKLSQSWDERSSGSSGFFYPLLTRLDFFLNFAIILKGGKSGKILRLQKPSALSTRWKCLWSTCLIHLLTVPSSLPSPLTTNEPRASPFDASITPNCLLTDLHPACSLP